MPSNEPLQEMLALTHAGQDDLICDRCKKFLMRELISIANQELYQSNFIALITHPDISLIFNRSEQFLSFKFRDTSFRQNLKIS